MSSAQDISLVQTTPELISEHAFKIFLWVGLGLCFTVCCLRMTTRLICFHRLLIEDYLIIGSMAILIGIAVVLQRFLADIYLMMHVENHLVSPGPDFTDRMLAGLRADGAVLILCTVGIWLIKLNFLIFFHRLGQQIRTYLIFWWVASFMVIGCLAVLLGVIPYSCSFGSFEHIAGECSTAASVSHIYTVYKVSISFDILSDAIIMCFPIVIVWRTRINLRQKLILTAIFLLVAFNVAVTIVRGLIFGNLYQQTSGSDRQVLDTSWALFWYYMEYVVSFIIASLISFRSLWVSRREKVKSQEAKHETPERVVASPGKSKWRKFHNSLLDTLTALEGTTLDNDDSSFIRLRLPSSRMDVDFSKWDSSRGSGSVTGTTTTTSSHFDEN